MEDSAPTVHAVVSRDILADIVTRHALPGIAASMGYGRNQKHRASGVASTRTNQMASAKHRLPISCAIKPLVALVCHYAVAEGILQLDEDLGSVLPALCGGRAGQTGISIRHLLTHTAGYVEPQNNDARWMMNWERFVEFFPTRKQAFSPGTVWSYSHTSFVIIQKALEARFDKSMRQILTDLVFSPLNAAAETLEDVGAAAEDLFSLHIKSPRTGLFEPMRPPAERGFFRYSLSDFLLSTVELATVATMLAGGLQKEFAHLEAARKALLTKAIDLPPYLLGKKGEAMPVAYCNGVADFGGLKGVNGSFVGSTCAIRFDEGTGFGLAVALNAWAPKARDRAAKALARPYVPNLRPARAPLFWDTDNSLAGTYEGLMLGCGVATITSAGDTFVCTVERKGMTPVTATLSATTAGGVQFVEGGDDLSMSVLPDPITGNPILMLGTSAYHRVS